MCADVTGTTVARSASVQNQGAIRDALAEMLKWVGAPTSSAGGDVGRHSPRLTAITDATPTRSNRTYNGESLRDLAVAGHAPVSLRVTEDWDAVSGKCGSVHSGLYIY